MALELVVLVLCLAVWFVLIVDERPFWAAVLMLTIVGIMLYVVDFPMVEVIGRRFIRFIGGLA